LDDGMLVDCVGASKASRAAPRYRLGLFASPYYEAYIPRGHASGSARMGLSTRLRMYCAPTSPAGVGRTSISGQISTSPFGPLPSFWRRAGLKERGLYGRTTAR